jgi:hypothetical protein
MGLMMLYVKFEGQKMSGRVAVTFSDCQCGALGTRSVHTFTLFTLLPRHPPQSLIPPPPPHSPLSAHPKIIVNGEG